MGLSVDIKEKNDHAYIVDLKGSIDNESYQDLEKRFKKITNDYTRAVYLNMACVDYVSSAGMGVLVTEKKLLQKNNAFFAMAGLQAPVKKVFDLMRLSTIFVILENLRDEEIDSILARHLEIPADQTRS